MDSQPKKTTQGASAAPNSKRKRPVTAAAAAAAALNPLPSAPSPASVSTSTSSHLPIKPTSSTAPPSKTRPSSPPAGSAVSAVVARVEAAANKTLPITRGGGGSLLQQLLQAGSLSSAVHSKNMLSTAPLPRGSVTLPIPEPPVTLSAATATTTTTAKLPVSGKNVPAFLNKLYNMVSDGSTNDLIHWSNDGTAFIVHRHEDFAREVLPRFFKHNNFSSFVRQLNMYGFHKIPHIQQGALYSDGEPEMWEFANPHFQKGQPDLLCLVTRKKGRDTDEKEVSLDLSTVLHEMSAIKRHQFSISSDLKSIQRENQILWSETVGLRERYVRQQQMIDRIVRFLASVVSAERPVVAKKRRLMLEDGTLAVAGESTSGKDTGTAGNAFLSSLLGESSVGEKRTLPGPLSDVQLNGIKAADIADYNQDMMQQKVFDLIQSSRSSTTPSTSAPSQNSVLNNPLADLMMEDPTNPILHNLSNLQNVTHNLDGTAKAAASIEDNINLLDVHLNTATNLLGIDGDHGINVNDFFDMNHHDLSSTLDQPMLSASTSSQSLNFDIHDEDEDEDDPLSSIVGPLPKRTPTVATGTGLMGLPHLDDVLTGLPAGTWQDGMWKSESGGLVGEGDGEAGTKELLSTVDDGDGKVGMEGFGSGWASTLSMDADFDMLLGNTTGNAY